LFYFKGWCGNSRSDDGKVWNDVDIHNLQAVPSRRPTANFTPAVSTTFHSFCPACRSTTKSRSIPQRTAVKLQQFPLQQQDPHKLVNKIHNVQSQPCLFTSQRLALRSTGYLDIVRAFYFITPQTSEGWMCVDPDLGLRRVLNNFQPYLTAYNVI
jgi:hypothetical protein